MINPFKNIKHENLKQSLQKKQGDKVAKKKAGRPKKLGVKKYQFTLPITLHTELKQKAITMGIDISAHRAQIVRKDILDV